MMFGGFESLDQNLAVQVNQSEKYWYRPDFSLTLAERCGAVFAGFPYRSPR